MPIPTKLCGFACLLTLAAAPYTNAHEGHDHDTPTGVWPTHQPGDPTAGFTVSASSFNTVGFEDTTSASSAKTNPATWLLADGATGTSPIASIDNVVSNILADVNTLAYDDTYAYLRTTGVPSHAVGDSPNGNPSTPGDIDATYRIPLTPTAPANSNHEATGLGAIGVMVNGVAVFNASDGTYWNPDNNNLTAPGQQPDNTDWSTNAIWRRAGGMDNAGGHPASLNGQTNPDGSALGQYHYHMTPTGLLDQIDPGNTGGTGSPIVGYAFDGYAIVGPYAYEDDGNGNLNPIQMTSSYGLQNVRGNDGPSTNDYELGSFLEDFVYLENSGHLNEFNMAFVKFDDLGHAILADENDPDADWAYFLTLDVIDALNGNTSNDTTLDGGVAYPYIVGPEYFGVPANNRGQITVPLDVTLAYLYAELAGDYNASGSVEQGDLDLVLNNWGSNTDATAGGSIPTGWINDLPDGNIDQAELDAVLNHWGDTTAPDLSGAAVPEPAVTTLPLVATACGLRRRNRNLA